MAISLWSVLSALLWSSIFVFLFSSLRRAVPVVKRSGPFPLLVLAGLVVLRLFLPVDLPWFTNIVSVAGGFTALTDRLLAPLWKTSLSVFSLFVIVWIIGAVYFLTVRIRSYLHFYKRVSQLLPDEEGEALEIAEAAAEILQMPAPLVIRSNRFDVPQICGLRQPIILMPTYSYSAEEYRFIFLHELQHWKTHDLWVKFFAELFCCVFWWNPTMKLWKSELDQELEMRCDRGVAQNMHADTKDIQTYIHVLNNTYLYSVIRSSNLSWNYAVANLCASERMLLQREAAILEHISAKKRFVYAFPAIILTAVLFVFSYAFEIHPYHQPDSFDLKLENAMISKEEIDWFLFLDNAAPDIDMNDFEPQSFIPLAKDGSVYGRVGSLSGAYLVSGAREYTLYIDGQRILSVDPDSAIVFARGGFPLLGDHEIFDPNLQYPVKEFPNGITLWSASYRLLHSANRDLLEPKFRYRHAGKMEYRYWNVTDGCWADGDWSLIS